MKLGAFNGSGLWLAVAALARIETRDRRPVHFGNSTLVICIRRRPRRCLWVEDIFMATTVTGNPISIAKTYPGRAKPKTTVRASSRPRKMTPEAGRAMEMLGH